MFKVPCEFREAKNVNGVKVGYRVKVYYVICESERPIPFDLHTFTSLSDAMDNVELALECGITAQVGYTYIHVSPRHYPSIYNRIESYVSQSSVD